jgi:Baseplate J-like protein
VNPAVDSRRREEIAREVNQALARRFPDWPAQGPTSGPAAALIQIFGEYCEMVLDRLNRAPDQRRLAFLDQIGVSRRPPQPARAPLQVTLAAGTVTAAVVPAGTQVASAPAPLSPEPVVFETETELVATAAVLDSIFVRDGAADQYTDLAPLLPADASEPTSVFTGARAIEHAFFIGHSTFLGQQTLDSMTVAFDLEPSAFRAPQAVSWDIWDGITGAPLKPVRDETAGLTQSGDVEFRDFPVVPEAAVDGRRNRWLRCRLDPPLARPTVLRSITLERDAGESGLPPDTALMDNVQLDLTKDFYPFGAKPQFGTVLYIASAQALGLTGAMITLRFTLTNPSSGDLESPIPPTNAVGRARVAWEYWDGKLWRTLGTGKAEEDVSVEGPPFSDKTRALTSSGEVTFRVPPDLQQAEAGGKKNYWIRARLAGGDYGREASYTVRQTKPGVDEYVLQPATLSAPMVQRLEIGYSLREAAQVPEALVTYNDFSYFDETGRVRSAEGAVAIFHGSAEQLPSLYLGFLPPRGLGMPSLPTTVYFVFATGRQSGSSEEDPRSPALMWQYWNGAEWRRFGVADHTGGFSYSGAVTFIEPVDSKKKWEFGVERYWLRASWRAGKDTTSPLKRILPNAIAAVQGVTINEVLGTGTGLPGQGFRTSRHPVLEGERIEVQEGGVWQAWSSVPDFLDSDRNARHYVIDHLTGHVFFGDGIRGRKPASGSSIRIRCRTGGGSAGNKGYDTVNQLKTTIPYVKGMTNPEAAEGGADVEPMDNLVSRAAAILRHGYRAVARQDYEDLAMIASPGVARALCMPLVNLRLDPAGERQRPGTVSLIIVPVSTDRRPQPATELLNRVCDFVECHQTAGVELIAIGPELIEIPVEAELGVTSLEHVSSLEMEIRNLLARFLHPLHGGFDGRGWAFGRAPHRSDLMSLLQSVSGVDHVRRLVVRTVEERPGASRTGHFLACAGDIQLHFSVE